MANEEEVRSKAKELGFDGPQTEQAVKIAKENPELDRTQVLEKVRPLKV